jgi:hypothetical protein
MSGGVATVLMVNFEELEGSDEGFFFAEITPSLFRLL